MVDNMSPIFLSFKKIQTMCHLLAIRKVIEKLEYSFFNPKTNFSTYFHKKKIQ
jgi:hypothetical protein